MLSLTYPHIEKIEHQPARLQRIPRIRAAQLVMDYLAYGIATTIAESHKHQICHQY